MRQNTLNLITDEIKYWQMRIEGDYNEENLKHYKSCIFALRLFEERYKRESTHWQQMRDAEKKIKKDKPK